MIVDVRGVCCDIFTWLYGGKVKTELDRSATSSSTWFLLVLFSLPNVSLLMQGGSTARGWCCAPLCCQCKLNVV